MVTVASHAHAQGRIDFDDLQGERSYSGARAYNQSKLANVLFTYELARRLQGTAVTANALHPGVVQHVVRRRGPRPVPATARPAPAAVHEGPAQGAATSIHLASAPELEQVTGRLLRQQQTQRSSERSYDEAGRGTAVAGERRPGPGRPDRDTELVDHGMVLAARDDALAKT